MADEAPMEKPYNSYADQIRAKYGYRIYRVGVDAGFSCPNRRGPQKSGGCVYCDSQGAVAAYLRTSESGFTHASAFEKDIDSMCCGFSRLDVQSQIARGREFVHRRYRADHFDLYLQSYSNTFAPVSRLKEIYDSCLEGYSWDGFIVSTRPDCIDEKKLELLASYKEKVGTVALELGLQSGDDAILKAMNRGHSAACLVNAVKLARAYGLEVCIHLLTGFPGEGYEQLQKTVDAVNQAGPDSIKIHNLNIASGTPLYENYLQGEVTAPCSTRHIANTVYILRRIPWSITVQRLIAETPSHRLASPRMFPDKNTYLRRLEAYMNENGFKQGDLYK